MTLSHLDELESESIYVLREVAAQFENVALLFSGGKDSIVLSYLARRAFWPARIPFVLMHIDTGHNFEETLTYRHLGRKTWGTATRTQRPGLNRHGTGDRREWRLCQS